MRGHNAVAVFYEYSGGRSTDDEYSPGHSVELACFVRRLEDLLLQYVSLALSALLPVVPFIYLALFHSGHEFPTVN